MARLFCPAFLIGALLSSCALWRPAPAAAPEVHLAHLQLLDRPGRGPRYLMALRIVNPSERELAIAALSCRLQIKGIPALEGFTGALHTLPPGSALRVELEARTDTLDRLKLTGRLADGARPDYVLEVRLRRPWTLMPLALRDTGALPAED
jgi:hypothetical protein